jgi:hypothetical protein
VSERTTYEEKLALWLQARSPDQLVPLQADRPSTGRQGRQSGRTTGMAKQLSRFLRFVDCAAVDAGRLDAHGFMTVLLPPGWMNPERSVKSGTRPRSLTSLFNASLPSELKPVNSTTVARWLQRYRHGVSCRAKAQPRCPTCWWYEVCANRLQRLCARPSTDVRGSVLVNVCCWLAGCIKC